MFCSRQPSEHTGACLEPLEARVLFSAEDAVLQWNDVWMDIARVDQVVTGPVRASRNAAMVHAAIYDAVAAVRGLEPLFASTAAPAYASVNAAIAGAASRMLSQLYPAEAHMVDAALHEALDAIPGRRREEAGLAIGIAIADQILDLRADDGSNVLVPYTYSEALGRYQPTSDNRNVVDPGWGNVTPFAMLAGSQFHPIAPPDLTSIEYAEAYNQVKELGAVDSATRTADQTEIGYFWAYDRAGLGTPVVFLNEALGDIARQLGNTRLENARLFALANVALADAGIASWECKYVYDLWRPVTGIRMGDADGNPLTEGDPDWQPLGAPNGSGANFTPPFPSYVAGHSAFGSAFFEVLRAFYGTDDVSFTLRSDELPGITRNYSSFTQAELENGISRIYLGVHWIFDDTAGQQLGRDVAGLIADQFASIMLPEHGEKRGVGSN